MVYSLFFVFLVLLLLVILFVLLQQFDEVDASRLGSRGRHGFGETELCVDDGIDDARQALCLSLKVDLHLEGIEGIEMRFDALPRELGRSLVEVSPQHEGRIATHESMQAIEEQTTQIGGGRKLTHVFDISLPAQQGSRSQPAVLREVIELLDPGPETFVQLLEQKRSSRFKIG